MSPAHAVLAALMPFLATGDDDALAGKATRSVQVFFDGEHDAMPPLMDATMQQALAAPQAAALAAQLVAGSGAVQSVGEGWFADTTQGYRRYRVPVGFERQTLDMLIVMDDEELVSGFFIVPHVPRPSAESEAGPPRREAEVDIGDGPWSLPGVLTLPEGDGPFPGVVMVHGSGPSDRDETIGPNKPFRDIAWGLAERGVATLRYDKRTHAQLEHYMETAATATVKDEVIDDALLALALLHGHDEVDGVYLLGHSLGGTVAPRIAAVEPRPDGVIVLAGSSRLGPDLIVEQTRYIVHADGVLTPEEEQHLAMVEELMGSLTDAMAGLAPAPEGFVFGAPYVYWADVAAHDPPAEAAALGLPLLVLQGQRDYQVTMEDFAAWRAALDGVDGACLASYAELDHLFRPGIGPSTPLDYQSRVPVDPRVLDDIAAWMRAGACPAGPPLQER